jgi:hypothetical protein
VKTKTELAAAANLNYVGSYRKLVEHSANGGFSVVPYATFRHPPVGQDAPRAHAR